MGGRGGWGGCLPCSLPMFTGKPCAGWRGQGKMGRQAGGLQLQNLPGPWSRVARVPAPQRTQCAPGGSQEPPTCPKMRLPPGWERAVTQRGGTGKRGTGQVGCREGHPKQCPLPSLCQIKGGGGGVSNPNPPAAPTTSPSSLPAGAPRGQGGHRAGGWRAVRCQPGEAGTGPRVSWSHL